MAFCSSEPFNQLFCSAETLISVLNLHIKSVMTTKQGNLDTILKITSVFSLRLIFDLSHLFLSRRKDAFVFKSCLTLQNTFSNDNTKGKDQI